MIERLPGIQRSKVKDLTGKDGLVPINKKEIQKMLKKIRALDQDWKQWTVPSKKSPPPMIPTIWTLPKPDSDIKDYEKEQEEEELLAFMQECQERTADMRDEEKCERCKLRFRCYTEIKVEVKRKTKTEKPKKVDFRKLPRKLVKTKPLTGGVVLDDFWRRQIIGVAQATRPNIEKEV